MVVSNSMLIVLMHQPFLYQARIMGIYGAQCMLDVQEDYGTDTQLELFAHITRFFGFKVRQLTECH